MKYLAWADHAEKESSKGNDISRRHQWEEPDPRVKNHFTHTRFPRHRLVLLTNVPTEVQPQTKGCYSPDTGMCLPCEGQNSKSWRASPNAKDGLQGKKRKKSPGCSQWAGLLPTAELSLTFPPIMWCPFHPLLAPQHFQFPTVPRNSISHAWGAPGAPSHVCQPVQHCTPSTAVPRSGENVTSTFTGGSPTLKPHGFMFQR